EGADGPVLGGVGDRVAVVGRLHAPDTALLGERERVVARAGKDVEAGVDQVLGELLLPGLLGVAGHLAHRAPSAAPATVAVGQRAGTALAGCAPGGRSPRGRRDPRAAGRGAARSGGAAGC